jgi:hypothetical protein
MSVVESVARIRVGNGTPVDRLVCHPRRPLVAGTASDRPAVHVWDLSGRQFREAGIVGADSTFYGNAEPWERYARIPDMAWHPEHSLLAVAHEQGILRWTAGGVSRLDGVSPSAGHQRLAFSPSGQALWLSPTSADNQEVIDLDTGAILGWACDVLDLNSGTVGSTPAWDTGVATHPAG